MLLWLTSSWGQVPVPPLTQHVTDLTGTLTIEQQNLLEQKLVAFETQKGSQIAVLIIPTTEPEDIAQFSIRAAEAWKLGRAKVDDGILLVVAKNDRKLRIEVGYGLEGVIPDVIAKRIIAETITPFFKAGDFGSGINAGVEQLIGLIQGEALPPPEPQTQYDDGRYPGNGDGMFLFILFGGLMAGTVLSLLFSRVTGGMLAGLGSGLIAAGLLGSVIAAAIIGFLVFFIIAGNHGGGHGWSNRGGGGFGGGGFGGGGFGGGSSWGGGGGGFGGGGASGSW